MKVSSVASKLTTLSAQDMIKAMIAGERDPKALAGLARGKMKAKHDDLVEALDGMFDDHHGELAGLLLEQIAFLGDRIARLSARAAELTAAMPAAWGINADGTTGPDAGTGPDAPALPAVARLAQIPGIREDQARTIITETGLDMSRFPTAGHPGVAGRAVPVGPPVRAPHPGRQEGPGQRLPARGPRPGRHRRRPAPIPSSASGSTGSPAAAARPRPRSPSPDPSWSSSGTCCPTPKPGSPTWATATTRRASTPTAS